jgi:hypothetical protein
LLESKHPDAVQRLADPGCLFVGGVAEPHSISSDLAATVTDEPVTI